MSGRVALRGAPQSYRSGVGTFRRGLVASMVSLAFLACGSDRTTNVIEEYDIVGGQPAVDPSRPTVDAASGTSKATDFASNAPAWVDRFTQARVPEVDILWVIDNSGSMQPKQDAVKANFAVFMDQLNARGSLLDYRIGVITTDTFNPAQSGRLQNYAGLSKPWISRETCGAGCDAAAKFRQNANVGTLGAGNEKPLLAAELALSAPLATSGANAGFLRPGAALFVVIVGDEDDGSCSPTRIDGGGCLGTPTYGTTDHFVRFFEGLKGPGHADLVTVGIVGALTDAVDLPSGNGRKGCQMAGTAAGVRSNYADYAPRLVEIANRTGGIAADICTGDYAGLLGSLGFLATGAKDTFYLTRAPFPQDLRVYLTPPGGARKLLTAGTDYDYAPCVGSSATVKNAIQFKAAAVPNPGAVVEVEYSVNVRGVRCPP